MGFVRRDVLVALGACVAICGLAFGATGAGAKTINPYVYKSSFDGTGSTLGPFGKIHKVAVNDQTGNVYVTDDVNGGVLSQFDADGNPVGFTDPALSGASSIVTGPYCCSDPTDNGAHVAIDNTGGSTQGNIYVHQGSGSGNMLGFDSTGKVLEGNWPICASPCGNGTYWAGGGGLQVAPDGIIWIGSRVSLTCPDTGTCGGSWISPFDVEGNSLELGEARIELYPPIPSPSIVGLGIDSQHNFYVGNQTQSVLKYGEDGELLNEVFDGGNAPSGNADLEIAVNRSNDRVFVNGVRKAPEFLGDEKMNVAVYEPSGELIDTFGDPGVGFPGIEDGNGVAVNSSNGLAYVTNNGTKTIDIFEPGPTVVVPDVSTDGRDLTSTSVELEGSVDPDGGGAITDCYFAWGSQRSTPNKAPCDQVVNPGGGSQTVTATVNGLNKGTRYYARLVAKNAADVPQAGLILSFRASNPPTLSDIAIRDVTTNTARATATINPEGGVTDYYIDYGTTETLEETTQKSSLVEVLGPNANTITPKDVAPQLGGLAPDTTYYYRITAENDSGKVVGPIRTFRTFPFISIIDDTCPNALARQQTGAALLLDCRAYELVSAEWAGGYNVESDLAPDETPFPGFPEADNRALYGVHAGVIPNAGNPTNRGLDPYIAARGSTGWKTTYVGLPANETPSLEPFASTLAAADSNLRTFAFGGPDICDPCFGDGTTGIPLRLPDGSLTQGMKGSLPVSDPEPEGVVAKPFSADGAHLVFASTDKFEEDGNSGQVSIYDRNLNTGVTRVVSKAPGGTTMTGPGIVQLDISRDGSRILLGQLVETVGGNDYFHLYMNVGASSKTIDLTPGTTSGVLYSGMTGDGSTVFFTSTDPLIADGDNSADLFRAEVSATAATLSRVSTGSSGTGDTDACTPAGDWNVSSGGPDCSIVAIGGGGGVASDDGTVYFFSPEKLDGSGNGTDGAPNLYAVRPGSPPNYVETFETTNPAIENGVSDPATGRTADFQVMSSGDHALLTSVLSLTGFENVGFTEVYRTDTDGAGVTCISCTPSNSPAAGDSSLASNGLSITDDGRVFFTSTDALALRDANNTKDVYEWTPAQGGRVELISTGSDPADSSLLSVTSDGRDVFFFTHETLVSGDENGPLVKLYDAREQGGFFVVPPKPQCAASDECHGPSSQRGPLPDIRTVAGTDGNVRSGKKPPRRCRKGFVKKRIKKRGKRGKRVRCVRKKKANRTGTKKRRGARRAAR